MSAIVTTEQLLEAMRGLSSEPPRAVKIKGLGEVYVRQITVGEMDAQMADEADENQKRRAARRACRLLCKADGQLLLNPDNSDHVAEMSKLPLRVLTAINKANETADDKAGN